MVEDEQLADARGTVKEGDYSPQRYSGRLRS
jgi:hypothetical protein